MLGSHRWWHDATIIDTYSGDIEYNDMPFSWTQYYKNDNNNEMQYCSLGYRSLHGSEITLFDDFNENCQSMQRKYSNLI